MNAEPGGGKILIASNRGPVSFTRGDDGNLTRHRGAGGLVSGLSTVAGQDELLWAGAALSDADRAAAKAAPGGRIDSGRGGSHDGSQHDGGQHDGGPQDG